MNKTFTEAERALLTRAAAAIIPASAAHGVPGADDPAIMAEIEASAAKKADAVRGALLAFAGAPDAVVFPQTNPAEAAVLQTVVVACYYRDPRVLASLGKEARAPFPQGYDLDPGDTSALERVRARGPIWRRA